MSDRGRSLNQSTEHRDGSVADPSFGELLRRLRLAAGLTQEELAERSGVSARSISDFEREMPQAPRRDTVALLADALALAPTERAALASAARHLRAARRVAGESADASPGAPTAGHGTESARHDLPIPPTPIIGREDDVAAVTDLLRRPEVRLVTLTGPPGVGKTRLALALAAALASTRTDGVRFVALASVSDARLVAGAIARTLGLREEVGQPALAILGDHLRPRHLLLILDNVEQVVDAATDVSKLLLACPGLTVLATSRAPLRVRGEWERPVVPLSLPVPNHQADPDALLRSPAVALFVARARAIQPDFSPDATNARAIATLCAHLDGLPLAIELAAPLLRLLPLPALLDRLDRRLPLLVGGARDLPPRQRTLRAAIDWSYELLRPAQRAIFRRLGAFVGDFSLEAAERVAGVAEQAHGAGARCEGSALHVWDPTPGARPPAATLEGLAALIEHSLLRPVPVPDGDPRFSMLETIREYAVERLAESDELDEARGGHAEYFLSLAEAAEPGLRGPDQASWLARLERERDNLRAALAWFLGKGDAEAAQRLGGALGWFWWTGGHLAEGLGWLERALALGGAPNGVRAKALSQAARLARDRRDLDRATAWQTESLTLAGQLGDARAAISALFGLGAVELARGAYAAAEGYYREALARAREADLALEVAGALHNLAATLEEQGRLVEAAALADDAEARFAELGDRQGVARARVTRADVDYRLGHLTAARARLEEALVGVREARASVSVALTLRKLGEVAAEQGACDRAWACCREGLTLGLEAGHAAVVAETLEVAARVARRQGRARSAARLLGAADSWRERRRAPRDPPYQAAYDREESAARAALGDEVVAAERAAGRGLAPDAAMDSCAPVEAPEVDCPGR